jgi:cell wall-associated NlpC family hydrolase
VTLDNYNLSHLPAYIMSEDQLSQYAIYMATLGNRPDLFPSHLYPNASTKQDYNHYGIPPEALSDPVFAAIIKEAEKYLGFPYVWGGSKPSTSFDCSGFVPWVINQTGWDVGRLGARGLYSICTPVSPTDARPGDLVYFHSTYKTQTPGISHVGIYVGDNMMIHCGNVRPDRTKVEVDERRESSKGTTPQG